MSLTNRDSLLLQGSKLQLDPEGRRSISVPVTSAHHSESGGEENAGANPDKWGINYIQKCFYTY